ncbi:hypothetical protein FQR65_LT10715 [Abscondita terminalis]|nr:hypothetical protein FQR65_LT10715 [Abscondita terminalis]
MPVRKSKRIEEKMMATSTPNPGLEWSSKYTEKNLSPILTHQNKPILCDECDSSECDCSDEWSQSEITSSVKSSKIKNHCTNEKLNIPVNSGLAYGSISALVVIGLTIVAIIYSHSTDVHINAITLKDFRDNFPGQSEDVWDAISSGIHEVKVLKKPSVFLLLYNYEASTTIDLFIHAVSRYASSILNEDSNNEAIILSSSNLNTVKAKSDYGYIISKYKPELEKRSIMIVKNLDKIPGAVAQAFHSICDEFTPLVGKSLIIFTMQVKSTTTNKSDFEIVEDILKRSWRELDDDIFYPLFTRITSIILRIEPEKKL